MKTLKAWLATTLWIGLAAQPIAAQPETGQAYLPATTQLYLEYQPRVVMAPGPGLGERLRRSPLARVIKRALPMAPERLRELAQLPFLNGRIIAAVVRQGALSPLELQYKGEQRYAFVTDLRGRVQIAFGAVNEYRRIQKRFPKTIQDLRAKGYYDEEPVDGMQLDLIRNGKKMFVRGRWQPAGHDPIEVLHPDITYDESKERPGLQGLLLGLGVPNSARLNPWLQSWDAELDELAAEGDHWRFRFDRQSLHVYLHRDWVYFTTSPELVAPFLRTDVVPARPLRANPRFAEQYKRLNRPDTESWVFVDIQDILQTSPALTASLGLSPEKILMRSFGHAASSRMVGGLLEGTGEGFLQWDGVQTIRPGTPGSADATLATRIPAGVETVFWFDLPGWVRLSDRLGGELPGFGAGLQLMWQALEERAGFPLTREALASGAQLYVYFEMIDIYAAELEAILQLIGVMTGTAADGADELFSLSSIPVLGVLELASPELAARVEKRLSARLGASAATRVSEGVSYRTSSDGRLGWSTVGTTQVWANGHTDRLLPRTVNTLQGKAPSLAANPTYARFQQGRQGELLAYVHGKTDRNYSIMKGLLLYLGSDFRPEAEILGRLRDVHFSLEVVPGGIALRSAIYSEGAQAPEPAKEKEEDRE